MNFKKSSKKMMLVVLILLFLVGNTNIASANVNHWFYGIETEMKALGLIDANQRFYLGDGFTESEMLKFLNHVFPERQYVINYDSTRYMTRIEMIDKLIEHMGLTRHIAKMQQDNSPFVDVVTSQSNVNFALRFNWISMNASNTFRPDHKIKKEEAYAILYRVYKSYYATFKELHSYYAINSYAQIDLTEDLNALSFGWSRLELNSDRSGIIINLGRTGSNEYSVPSGYISVLNTTAREGLSRQLMIFVKDEIIYDTSLKKNISLTEAILANDTWRQSVVDGIMATLNDDKFKNVYDGVLIDFEGLKGEKNAENMNLFIKMISDSLKSEEKSLYVAVHPVGLNNASYFDGYDYRTIGKYADRIILMAHDYNAKRLSALEMSIGYTVTPLTPINEIFYALANITDPIVGVEDSTKVLLQFSMDSAQWKLRDDKVIHAAPYRPLYSSILSRIDAGANVNYSKNLESPYITFNDPIDGTYNVVWYENETSIKAKIDMAKLFNIGGISVWRLGTIPNFENGNLNIWDMIRTHINQ